MSDLAGTLRDTAEMLLNEGKNLTKWEENFLESVVDKLDRSIELSGREREILTTLYKEKVS